MKRLFLFIIALAILLSVFLKSNTWETHRKIETKMGVEYTVIEHRINWSNFFRYLNYLYRSALDKLPLPTR